MHAVRDPFTAVQSEMRCSRAAVVATESACRPQTSSLNTPMVVGGEARCGQFVQKDHAGPPYLERLSFRKVSTLSIRMFFGTEP